MLTLFEAIRVFLQCGARAGKGRQPFGSALSGAKEQHFPAEHPRSPTGTA